MVSTSNAKKVRWTTVAVVFLVVVSLVVGSAWAQNPAAGQQRRCQTSGSGPCLEICRTATGNASDLRCPTPSRDAYSLALEATVADANGSSDEPIVKLALPACKDVTLNASQFTLLADGDLRANVGNVPQRVSTYVLSPDNTTARLCYPLSPQLLQCTLKQLKTEWYSLLVNGSLLHRRTGVLIDFRDYYTESGRTGYIACTEPVNAIRRLRCNYILYHRDEYRFEGDANQTLRLLPTNDTVYRPEYTEIGGNGTINLCYPSSPSVTRCVLWVLQQHEYQILDDRRLLETVRQTIHHMSDYLVLKDGKVIVCSMPPGKQPDFDMYDLLAYLHLLSAILLLVAFVIHLLIPNLNYHAKPLLCHMFSMAVMYVCLFCRKKVMMGDQVPCYTTFVFTYLSSAASFFWLNVLAFDLWCIFANLQTNSGPGLCCCWWCPSCDAKKHRFYYYSLYAWGSPVILLTFTLLVDAYRPLQDAIGLYPGLSHMCWFNDWKAALLLMHVPLFVVLAINLLLFVSTVINLRRASKGVEIVNKKLNTQLLFVCFKIFVVMGISWISEAISHAVNTHGSAVYLPDIINATQGVTIFAIYICKPATYRLLRKRFCGKSHSDGKWTTDFNTSKSVERKTSSSGLSMNSVAIRENSLNSDHLHVKKIPTTPIKSKSDAKV